MKQIKKRRKNPPQFYNEIKNLIGEVVIVRSRNSGGFFSIGGILYDDGNNTFVIISNDLKTMGIVRFNLKIIEKIQNTSSGIFIDLQPSFHHDYGRYIMLEEILKLVNKKIMLSINEKMYIKEEKLATYPYIHGKLKYDKKNSLFYINSYNSIITANFFYESVRNIIEDNIEIEI